MHEAVVVAPEDAIGARGKQPPSGSSQLFLEPDLGAPGEYVSLAGAENQAVRPARVTWAGPSYATLANEKIGVLGYIENIGISAVHRIPLRPEIHAGPKQLHGIFENHLLGKNRAAGIKLLPENVSGERERSAGVFLFA